MARAKTSAIEGPDPKRVGKVQNEAAALPDRARALAVTDEWTARAAAEFLLGCKALGEEVDQTFDPDIARWHEGHKAALATKKRIRGPIDQAVAIVKASLGAWHRAQEEARRAEAKRLEDERLAKIRDDARDRKESAEEAAARGDFEAAERLADRDLNVPPPVAVSGPAKLEGVGFSSAWKFEVYDEALVPAEFCSVDERKIGAHVRAQKGAAVIPGVRIWEESAVAAGVRR
jgi:hypothetical protein